MQLPFQPYEQWNDTRITLHLILQIIGKIRLKSTPRKNHWWYITQYISTDGFSTHPIPMDDGLHSFEIILNVHSHVVELKNSKGQNETIALIDGVTVANFYAKIMDIMNSWGIHPDFIEKPMDMGIDKRFSAISEYHHFDWKAITEFWAMMRWVDGVFKEFSGRFYGKTCPSHLYWHHMDLAVTRFSGKKAPAMPAEARISDKDAYSHEVISFGFWAGDDTTPTPTFYAYAAPSPPNLDQESLAPNTAAWIDANGSPMAVMAYNDLLSVSDPRQTLLDFLESAYQGAAKLANWDVEALTVQSLEEM